MTASRFEPRPASSAPLALWCAVVFASATAAAVAEHAADGGDHPARWDPRVADLAAFVEDARDLEFRHPVHVDFLDAKQYSVAARGEAPEQTAVEREASQRDVGRLRALGLVSGDLDLAEAAGEVADEGTLAYYSTEDDRVRVRGTRLTPGLRVTLVHELTHALQDQHFDLERLDEVETSGASFAFRALAEGDAIRVEQAYLQDELSDRERAEAEREETPGEAAEPGSEPLAGVPDGLVALFSAPYALGPPLAGALAAKGGNDAVDDAFDDPPVTEEHLLDLLAYIGHDQPHDVDDLDAAPTESVIDRGDFGALTWFLLLATRTDPFEALRAADGWGGDTYLAVERDDLVCVRARFVGDTPTDGDEMFTALEEWRERMPGDQHVARRGEAIELETCDPGPKAPGATSSPLDALALPALRGYLVADALHVLDADGARCYATRVLDGLTIDQIADPDSRLFERTAFQERASRAFRACRGTR